jgi:hypothetical protein
VAVSVPVTATVNLTVNGQALFIRMQTDNLIGTGTGTFTKSYYALVTDSGGNPVTTGLTVVFTLEPANIMSAANGTDGLSAGASSTQCEQVGQPACPGAYEKGQWQFDGLTNTWFKAEGGGFNYYTCLNEDLLFNGILEPGEDYNSNGKLDPGNVAGVNNSAVTDKTTGIAIANVTYPQGFATWSAVNLTATITVAGTEFISSVPFVLPIPPGETQAAESSPPPGLVSPFGTHPCIDPN